MNFLTDSNDNQKAVTLDIYLNLSEKPEIYSVTFSDSRDKIKIDAGITGHENLVGNLVKEQVADDIISSAIEWLGRSIEDDNRIIKEKRDQIDEHNSQIEKYKKKIENLSATFISQKKTPSK